MLANNLTKADAAARCALLERVSYDVALDLAAGDDTFGVRTDIRFTCRQPGGATFLDLVAESVQSIEVNGETRPLDSFAGDRIVLDGLGSHNHVSIEARCPYDHNGVGLHRFVDPTDGLAYLHTQFEPFDAHRVYACFDQPDIKAPFSLQVTAPAAWTLVSNSPVLERRDGQPGDTRHWRFRATPPISPYLTALVAGPFRAWSSTHGPIALGIFCRQSLAEFLDVEELWDVTHRGLDFFSQQFGRAYPFEKYDQLFVPEFNAGAMENAGCVTFSESYVFRSKITEAARESRANTILHEMAHMWFGDLVTMRWWDDLWLNESFATYMAYLASADATRFTKAWARFASSMKAWAYAEDQLPSTHPISTDIADTESVRLHFDGISYAKGASVLRQLVAWVGRDGFERGVRHYFGRHEWANATLADFLAALEEASSRPLVGWAKEWLQTAGVNTLRLEVDEDGDHYRSVSIVQTAPHDHPTLRSHRLAVGLYRAGEAGLVRTGR
ncbi:MAG TPA: aminopeptidase N, partial [Acidimicrobiales bacterium]